MFIGKGLQVTIRPSIQDPVLNVGPCGLTLVLSFIPAGLDLRKKGVSVRLGGILGLDALGLQIGLQLVGIPCFVRSDRILIPVLLDQILEILSIGGCGVRDIMIREPSLELGLMPLVVSCRGDRLVPPIEMTDGRGK